MLHTLWAAYNKPLNWLHDKHRGLDVFLGACMWVGLIGLIAGWWG